MNDAQTESEKSDPPDRLINRRQLRQQIPASDMTIWRWQKLDKFPNHLSINGRNYWRLGEITAWLKEQTEASASNDGGGRC